MQKLLALFVALRCDVAALLLRVAVAAAAIGAVQLLNVSTWPLALTAGALAAGLTLGMATLACAAICLFAEIILLPIQGGLTAFLIASHALAVLALVCLGPGNYSLDAQLFARRKRVLTNRSQL
jgi:hypothetical protein